MDTLCHAEFWRWDDEWYLIAVYQDTEGAFYTAEAQLGPDDWVMVDASSAAEAMQQMRVALAGAVGSRRVAGFRPTRSVRLWRQ
jgi:hypothetical protein